MLVQSSTYELLNDMTLVYPHPYITSILHQFSLMKLKLGFFYFHIVINDFYVLDR